ncbi:MAG: TonB-dependent receptor [bacterium]
MPRFFCTITLVFLILLFFIPPGSLNAAETGKISGRVIDKNSREPIIGANVFVDVVWMNEREVKLPTIQGASTDTEGRFVILALRPGEYNLKCSVIGYGKKEVTKVKVNIDKTTEVNFELTSMSLQIEEVVVTAFKPNEVEKDLTATKQTYDISDVEKIAGVTTISDVIALQADVVDNHFRGGREGESMYLIGGGSINNPLDASKSFEPMVSALQTVEVLTSGFSAEFGNAQSGVINMVPKEGGDRWTVRTDFSIDLPHSRLWGGNPYSIENMSFYKLLSTPEEWIRSYYEYGNTTPRSLIEKDWRTYIVPNDSSSRNYSRLNSKDKLLFMRMDSLRAARFALVSWLQSARDLMLEESGIPQHRLNLTLGGPISESMRLFISVEQEKKNASVPEPNPDLNRQLMSNLTIQWTKEDKLTLSYFYSYSFKNGIGGPSDWFDRILQDPKTIKTSQQIGIRWMHHLNQFSFADIAVRMLNTRSEVRPEFLDPGRFIDVNAFNGGKVSGLSYIDEWFNSPTWSVNTVNGNRGVERTTTYSFDGSYTLQATSENLLKSGIQFQSYVLDLDKLYGMNDLSDFSYSNWKVTPYEGALYIQDKMEFQGLIANVGLRFDYYNINYDYYTNIFDPLKNPADTTTGALPDPSKAPKARTKPFGRLQPRFGISFPVSEYTVFHLNYGTFVQRPPFNYVIGGQYKETNGGLTVVKIGNAQLRPEKTSAWDVGIVHSLLGGLRIDLSAYYKDVNDLIEQADYIDLNTGIGYTNYSNKDYAAIKGFNVNLEQRKGLLNFRLRYNYQIAKGKASGPGGSPITIFRTRGGNDSLALSKSVGTRDILLDYDRTHRLLANLTVVTTNDDSPEIFGFKPFANSSVSLTFTFQSGRPYSDFSSGDLTTNNVRMPDLYDFKIRLQKSFKLGSYRYTAYVEGFNILNQREWSYSDIFKDKYNTLRRWNDGERESLIWYDPKYEQKPNVLDERYLYSNAYSVYENQPRYVRLGIWIEL